MIRVLLVGLSPALRAGIRALLASDDQIKVVGEVSEWSDELQADHEVDVVITTSTSFQSYQDGDMASSSPFAILLVGDNKIDLEKLGRSVRAWGILPYEASAEELCAAISALSQGLIVGTQQLLFSSNADTAIQSPLTDREQEVLALLAKGMANKQIAVALGISEHTVKFHVSSIYSKLNVTNRTEAVREGLRGGWIAL